MELLGYIGRGFLGVTGLFLLYVAWGVFEDEEKAMQSKVEEWWLQFDMLRQTMATREAAFISVVTQRANAVFSRIFPEKLLSLDAVGQAILLSCGSLLLAVSAGGLYVVEVAIPRTYATFPEFLQQLFDSSKSQARVQLIETGAYGAVLLLGSLAPLASKHVRWLTRGLALLVIVRITINSATQSPTSPLPGWIGPVILLIPLAGATVLTILAVHLMRQIVAQSISGEGVRFRYVIGIAIPLLPFIGAAAAALTLDNAWHATQETLIESIRSKGFFLLAFLLSLFLIIGAEAVVAAALGVFLSVTTIMLAHKLMWPLTSRLLYQLPRHRVVESKKFLSALAAALLSVAFLGTRGLEPLKKLIGF